MKQKKVDTKYMEVFHVDAPKRYKILVGLALFLLVMLLAGTLTGRIIGASSQCGNSVCEVGENRELCPEDCMGLCGNSLCEGSESWTCPADCPGEERRYSLLDGLLEYFA